MDIRQWRNIKQVRWFRALSRVRQGWTIDFLYCGVATLPFCIHTIVWRGAHIFRKIFWSPNVHVQLFPLLVALHLWPQQGNHSAGLRVYLEVGRQRRTNWVWPQPLLRNRQYRQQKIHAFHRRQHRVYLRSQNRQRICQLGKRRNIFYRWPKRSGKASDNLHKLLLRTWI